MNAESKDKLEYEWVKQWRKATGNSKPPCRVMHAYAELLDISVSNLDDQVCWDCWPEDLADDVATNSDGSTSA